MATFFQLVGVGFFVLVTEYSVFKGKDYYIFFIGFTIMVCIGMVIQNFDLTENIFGIALLFAIFVPISYIYLAYKLSNVRRYIVLIFLGFLLYIIGKALTSLDVIRLLEPFIDIHLIYLISALIQILALLILAVGVKRMYFS